MIIILKYDEKILIKNFDNSQKNCDVRYIFVQAVNNEHQAFFEMAFSR